jgi:acyl-CoA synthetase (AMP-forming)/AMP-acid ligase II
VHGPAISPEAGRPEDLGLIQYTSGSTGNPRGVALTHANILANLRDIAQGLALGEEDRGVSWLPLYHDMGLIGMVLSMLLGSTRTWLIPPETFLFRPIRWLETLSRVGGTISTAPNFGYQLCVDRVPEEALARLDLRLWRRALNGAEPVRPATLEAFARRFAPCGFRQEAWMPVYGLAETALAAAFPPLGRAPRYDDIDAELMRAAGRAEPAAEGRARRRVVSVGNAFSGSQIRVADPESGAALPERREGEILLRGPSIMRGYFEDPEATREAIRDGWLWTGDLGYLAGGELFLTGRSKAVLIRAGRKFHAADLERAAERVPGIRRGCSAALAVEGPEREKIVLVVERSTRTSATPAELSAAVAAAVAEAEGIQPDRVEVVPARSVPKTSSGKVQRSLCREMLLAGSLGRPIGTGRRIALTASVRGLWRRFIRKP